MPSVYKALNPYVTRGPDESCHELSICSNCDIWYDNTADVMEL